MSGLLIRAGSNSLRCAVRPGTKAILRNRPTEVDRSDLGGSQQRIAEATSEKSTTSSQPRKDSRVSVRCSAYTELTCRVERVFSKPIEKTRRVICVGNGLGKAFRSYWRIN